MEIFIWLLGSVLLFMGLYLIIFPEKFLSYDSKRLPNFWDNHHKRDVVITNWKSRRKFTIAIGIVFLVAGLFVFCSTIYNVIAYAKLA